MSSFEVRGSDVPKTSSVMGQVCASHGRVSFSKDKFILELAALVPMKAKDPFLYMKKKVGPVLDLEAQEQAASALAIIETEAPQLIQSKLPSQKGRGKALQCWFPLW